MSKKDFSEGLKNRPSKTNLLFQELNENKGDPKTKVRNSVNTEIRIDKKNIDAVKQTVKIERKLYKKLKKYCVDQNQTFQDFIVIMIKDYFAKLKI